jgi:uncharacterized PurR-regulated membrane protein YhhQ (DUF165 family)
MAILCSLLLDVGAFLMAIPGDGSYVFVGLFSAPISLLGYVLYLFEIPGVLLAIVGIPLLGIMAGIFGTIPDKTKRRVYLGVFLAVHYVGATLVLLQTEPYGNWKILQEQWSFPACKLIILFSLAVYLLGQMWLWLQLLRSFGSRCSNEPERNGNGQPD